jgi:hypothetical protein
MAAAKTSTKDVARFADMFTALGAEPRLRIMRLLLSAHPVGLVVGEIQAELETSAAASTSFANPAVTLARALTPTFSGIRSADVPGFFAAQLAGAAAAAALFAWLIPAGPVRSELVK